MLHYADWYNGTEQAEIIEIDEANPAVPVERCGKTPLEAWRKLAARQLVRAGAAATAYDDSRPEAAHHEMTLAKTAIDFYFRSWTEDMESRT